MDPKLKKQIDFSRTYRHLKINKLVATLYLILFVIPLLILLLVNYSKFTYEISQISRYVLEPYMPGTQYKLAAVNSFVFLVM